MEWISVKDRLPEMEKEILVWVPEEIDGYVYTASLQRIEITSKNKRLIFLG